MPLPSPLLTTHDLGCGYDGRFILDHVDLEFPRGQITCVLGRSGGGKSTLFRTLLLLEPPLRGDLRLEGSSLAGLSATKKDQLRLRYGVLFQGAALFGNLTLAENVAFPLIERGGFARREALEAAVLKLGLVGLSSAATKLPSAVSGGMRKRCGIARALALDPQILFLDEPGAGLDPITAADLDRLILDLKEALGTTMLVITHEMDSVRRIADRIVLLDQGGVLVQGSKDEVYASPIPAAQAFLLGLLPKREGESEAAVLSGDQPLPYRGTPWPR